MRRLFALLFFCSITSIALSQTKDDADRLHQEGRDFLSAGKIAEGRESARKAMEIRKALYGEVNEDYINSLNNYALSYFMAEDYPEAVRNEEKVMELCGRLASPHPNLGMYTINMGRFLYMDGKKKEAAQYWEKAIPLVEKHGVLYEFLLENTGMIYVDLGDTDGMQRILKLTEEHNQHELWKEPSGPEDMLKRAQYYAQKGDEGQAKEWFLKALGEPMSDSVRMDVYRAYASFLYGLRDFSGAAKYKKMEAGLIKKEHGVSEASVLASYYAAVYQYLGKEYQGAVDSYEEVLDFYRQSDSPAARANEARCYKGIGNAYSAMRDHAHAKDAFGKELELIPAGSGDYAKALLRLAKAEKFAKDYSVSIKHHREAMALFESLGMTEEYADAATSLRLCLAYAGESGTVKTNDDEFLTIQKNKMNDIIAQETSQLDITRTYRGKKAFAQSLATIARCHAMLSDYPSAVNFFEQYVRAVRESVRESFLMQTPRQRLTTWDEEKTSIQEIKELLVTLPVEQGHLMGRVSAIAYDASLLSKGILLNSSIEFEKVLSHYGSAELTSIYELFKDNEKEAERLRLSASTEKDLGKIVKLTETNQALALKLYRGCAEYADYTDYLSYTWKDVQRKLGDNDLAIEFLSIDLGPFDANNWMAALVLGKGMDSPAMVPVCPLAAAKAMSSDNELFMNEGNPVWGAFGNLLNGKERIYFSADGAFNQTAIEYLLFNGRVFSEQFRVYRLSSTKVLCYGRAVEHPAKAAVIGDIDYNSPGKTIVRKAEKPDATRGSVGEFDSLAETRREINNVVDYLHQASITDVVNLRNTDASAEAFINLSGSGINLLHVATHGVFDITGASDENGSMNGSQLIFAGANLGGGRVSAADIANMDLRQCDLAVLSACETGLGKLGDDGVFGLQRGFKNAGVRCLLMSLKPVYDSSTADLMIAFYKNLAAGMSIHDAFTLAQKELRNSGFSDAKYWAPFILLDASDDN